ncbi:hypothetical protein BGW42_008537 [Actinomortierella wolfii]|nr:hypothetical protein BGW42_008537 [Actinomortierella wolfii]
MAPDFTTLDIGDALATSEDLRSFLNARSVRNGWIALWCLWMVWALLFLAKQVLGGQAARRVGVPHQSAATGTQPGVETGTYTTGQAPATTASTGEVREKGIIGRSVDSLHNRVSRASDLARDLTLFLLIGLTVNSIAHGSGVSVLVLAWIYFVFALIWLGIVLLFENFIIDVIMGVIQFGLILAILSIAYHYGW